MYSAQDIAKWFLYKNYAEQKAKMASNDDYEVYDGITHLKLQKLLYNAQGVYLALRGSKLFSDDLEAWEHGPVVRNVYDTYCVFGKNPIIIPATPENDEAVRKIESDKDTKEILDMVYDSFSIYTAWQLREMSHVKNSPWDKTEKNKVIDVDLIKKYFESEVVEK
jgi:uncharacterized phage-associated protein